MISAITLFCEDIRPEIGGSSTIMGVLPDNIGVPSVPGALPKFGIYTRIAMASDAKPRAMQVVLRDPAGEERVLGVFTSNFVKDTCEQARQRGNPLAGFVSTAVASPFPIAAAGRFLVLLRAGSKEQIAGSVNFEVGEEDLPSRSIDH